MPRSRFPTVPRLAVTAGLAALVAISPGWSSPTWASTSTAQRHGHSVAAPKHKPLSGKWAGNYRGSFSGTFALSWQESGHSLSGTIRISGFQDEATSIHGTVQGTSIRFGTVGSEAITYVGSVSGKSMSGTWKIGAAGRSMGGGSWTASKSS